MRVPLDVVLFPTNFVSRGRRENFPLSKIPRFSKLRFMWHFSFNVIYTFASMKAV